MKKKMNNLFLILYPIIMTPILGISLHKITELTHRNKIYWLGHILLLIYYLTLIFFILYFLVDKSESSLYASIIGMVFTLVISLPYLINIISFELFKIFYSNYSAVYLYRTILVLYIVLLISNLRERKAKKI